MRARSVLLAVLLVVGASLGALGASAAAPIRYGVSWYGIERIGPDCVSGVGPLSTTLDVTLHDRSGDLETVSVDTAADGAFLACFADGSVRPGRSLVAAGRTFLLPALTVGISRARDRISGTGPKRATLKVTPYDCGVLRQLQPIGSTTGCRSRKAIKLTVPRSGTWAAPAGFDVGAADAFVAVATTKSGDRIAQLAVAPLVAVLTSPIVPPTRVTLMKLGATNATVRRLQAPGGPVLEEKPIDLLGGVGVAELGALEPGDQVTANVASDAKLQIPAVAPTLLSSPERIRARCFPRQRVGITVGFDITKAIWVKANAAGIATLPLAPNGLDASEGSVLAIVCETAAGDILEWVDTLAVP